MGKLRSVAKINKSKLKMISVALHAIIPISSTSIGARRSMDGATFVRQMSLDGRCLSSATT